MKAAQQLPDKLSDLITVAVDDCLKIQKADDYKLLMGVWHSPNYTGDKCAVCMAGAVMVHRLDVKKDQHAIPCDFDFVTQNKLYAIDDIRCGSIVRALGLLGIHLSDAHIPIIYTLEEHIKDSRGPGDLHGRHGRAPWSTYRKVARKLRALGY